MNYRHDYHAGNFADVLKHVVLALVIEHLKRKNAPFRVIDTHAGAGLYALESAEARKTGEWCKGIGRLFRTIPPLPAPIAMMLAPYLDAVAAENRSGQLDRYPGSPRIARRLLRPNDTLIANELHPEDARRLAATFRRDRQTKVMAIDGWLAVRSLLPPKERRGVILIDPPFEETDEFARLANALSEGLRRFATGIFLLWYPIKDPKPVARFHALLAAQTVNKLLRVELLIRAPRDPKLLNGCGLIVVNPPHTLETALVTSMPDLCCRLAQGAGAGFRLDWITKPAGKPAGRIA
jgi:23S rRNA (adenine2030-N6)-methyltransferase